MCLSAELTALGTTDITDNMVVIVRQHTPVEEPQVEGDDVVAINFPQ